METGGLTTFEHDPHYTGGGLISEEGVGMRRNRAGAIAQLFEDLANGDPIAWAFVGFFVVLAVGLGLFVLKIRRDLRREDEARAKKYGRKS
ncbi:hypothetical protein [Fimbriiglobus ruber]|uniref:Uncharacterized protein n=1 Tax=Fimbriiglobus ruber TaxID=1908690 RepID=A0A225DVM9_9BACT|nr:hypothetical protein [Fimbriiglobus ruber]OWK45431.1 hypothetical protein FRUB_01762 [Fimbriiglobus ruber]